MSPANKRAGPAYPTPKNRFELSAYKIHVIANYLDDVKNDTPKLVRAVVFLWAVIIVPLILLCTVAARIDWAALPFDWKWVTGIGGLGTIAIGSMGWRRVRGRARAIDRPDPAPAVTETGQDRIDQLPPEKADGHGDHDQDEGLHRA